MTNFNKQTTPTVVMSSTAHNQCHWSDVVPPVTSVINSSVDSPLVFTSAFIDKKNDDNNCHLLNYDDDPHQTYTNKTFTSTLRKNYSRHLIIHRLILHFNWHTTTRLMDS